MGRGKWKGRMKGIDKRKGREELRKGRWAWKGESGNDEGEEVVGMRVKKTKGERRNREKRGQDERGNRQKGREERRGEERVDDKKEFERETVRERERMRKGKKGQSKRGKRGEDAERGSGMEGNGGF